MALLRLRVKVSTYNNIYSSKLNVKVIFFINVEWMLKHRLKSFLTNIIFGLVIGICLIIYEH